MTGAIPRTGGIAAGRHVFASMGTTVEVIAAPDGSLLSAAARRVEAVFEELDHRFSRFRRESELSWVNARAGRRVRVSHDFASLVRRSLRAARETGGLFDPTVLSALLAAGYDRDLHELRRDRPNVTTPATVAGMWRDVEIHGDHLRLPPDAGFDFGGIAKGWAVDRSAAVLEDFDWGLVNAGGDLRVTGRPAGRVTVGVEDPASPDREVARLTLEGGSLSTSSITRRTWGHGLHHLIDPRTGLPAHTGVLQATVWAETCTDAEVGSKRALLLGEPSLDDVPGLLVLRDGTVLSNLETHALAGEPA